MRFLTVLLTACLAAHADAQMLSEDFESGIPFDWGLNNSFGANTTFRHLDDGECGAITGMVGFTGDACTTVGSFAGGVGPSLRTPSFIFTGAGPYQLRLDSILSIDPVFESVAVSVIVQSNTPSFTLLQTADFQNNGMLESFALDIPASLEGETAFILFSGNVSSSGGGSFGWRIDNVEVDGAGGRRYCFGFGTVPVCPCGNDANFQGGCLNSAGVSGALFATGSARVSNDQLNFVLTGGVPGSFALLASADNQLPASNPGAGTMAFDGLRCIGGNLIRHGVRAIDPTGFSDTAWGAASGQPLIAQGGFVAGQTRQWQVFYRDDIALGCQTGQNTSNAVETTFAP